MTGLVSFLLLATASATAPPSVATWEKIFEVQGGREMWISAAYAESRDDWFAVGRWGVSRNTKEGINKQETPGKAVLGLFVDGHDVFALGDNELILRFNGKTWIEEHVGPKPKRKGRGADLLTFGYRLDDANGSNLVVMGPWLVLVRERDNTWRLPGESERQRLEDIGQAGPRLPLPGGCAQAGWFWLGHKKGFLACHDGRSFIVDDQKVTPKGKLPRACTRAFNAVATGQNEVFANCGPGKVWKTDADGWHLFATFKGEKELPSLSVTADCVFVGGRQKLWRSCTSR